MVLYGSTKMATAPSEAVLRVPAFGLSKSLMSIPRIISSSTLPFMRGSHIHMIIPAEACLCAGATQSPTQLPSHLPSHLPTCRSSLHACLPIRHSPSSHLLLPRPTSPETSDPKRGRHLSTSDHPPTTCSSRFTSRQARTVLKRERRRTPKSKQPTLSYSILRTLLTYH